MFVLRKISTEDGDEIREFQSVKEAEKVMRKEYKAVERDYEFSNISKCEASCTDGESGKYIAWLIYKRLDERDLFSRLLIALKMAEIGLTKYQIELESAEDCGGHIYEAQEILNQIREGSKSLMLWDDDFVKRDWKAICEALDLPEDTQEAELRVTVVTHFPHKHGRAEDGETEGKCKACPRRRVCKDECYGENPCDFALAFDRIGHKLDLKDTCIESLRSDRDKARGRVSEHRIFGDYVLTPAPNVFNGKTSWWISKSGSTVARYCFSASEDGEVERQIKGLPGYIKMLESTLRALGKGRDESGADDLTWKDSKWANWKECPHCGSSIQQAEDFRRSGLYEFCPRCGKRMSTHIGGEQQ